MQPAEIPPSESGSGAALAAAPPRGWRKPFATPEAQRIARVYGPILFISSALLLFSTWLAAQEGTDPTPAEFFHALTHEFGMAGLLVVLLALTFERISKREFERVAEEERGKSVTALRQAADQQLGVARAEFERLFQQERAMIKKDVYVGVFGKRIPEAVRDAIEVQILESPFARRNVELTFWLYPVKGEGGTGYMAVHSEVKYDVENLSSAGTSRVLEITPFVTKPPAGLHGTAGFRRFSAKGCKAPFDLGPAQLSELTFDRGADLALHLAPRYTIEVANEPTSILVESVEVDHLRFSRQSFIARHYITDLTLTVHTPKCGPNIQVSAKANSFNKLEQQVAHTDLGHFRWKTTGPLLPLQSVNIYWVYDGPDPA